MASLTSTPPLQQACLRVPLPLQHLAISTCQLTLRPSLNWTITLCHFAPTPCPKLPFLCQLPGAPWAHALIPLHARCLQFYEPGPATIPGFSLSLPVKLRAVPAAVDKRVWVVLPPEEFDIPSKELRQKYWELGLEEIRLTFGVSTPVSRR